MTGGVKNLDLSQTDQAFRNTAGSLAMPTAIRRAALRVNSLARDRAFRSGRDGAPDEWRRGTVRTAGRLNRKP